MNIFLIAWLILTSTSSLLVLCACIVAGRADDIQRTLPKRRFRQSSAIVSDRLPTPRMQPSTAAPLLIQARVNPRRSAYFHTTLRSTRSHNQN